MQTSGLRMSQTNKTAFARLQVVWLRHFLGPDVVAVLKWLGLRPLPATAGALENALRVKVLILIAVAFKRRSERCEVACSACVAGRQADACIDLRAAGSHLCYADALQLPDCEHTLTGCTTKGLRRPGATVPVWSSLPSLILHINILSSPGMSARCMQVGQTFA